MVPETPRQESTEGNRKTVFVIEDDPQVLGAEQAKLMHEGFDVALASDGDMALTYLADHAPDAIVLDLMLPRRSGLEVLDYVRKDNRLKDVPVFVITNLTQEKDREIAKAHGATEFLVKSETPIEDVVRKIKEHVAS